MTQARLSEARRFSSAPDSGTMHRGHPPFTPGMLAIMTLPLHADPLPLAPDATGTIRVANTRVTLDSLVAHFRAGGHVHSHHFSLRNIFTKFRKLNILGHELPSIIAQWRPIQQAKDRRRK